MDNISKTFIFENVPPVFKRDRQVMLAIFDRDVRLYLARKHAYPIDIYRLFGGGVEPNETILEAAQRELIEETSLTLPLDHRGIFTFKFQETISNKTYNYTADLFYVFLQTKPIEPGDDVNGMKIFLKPDLVDLNTLYCELPQEQVTGKDQQTFSWHDWGTVFSEINGYILKHWPVS